MKLPTESMNTLTGQGSWGLRNKLTSASLLIIDKEVITMQ